MPLPQKFGIFTTSFLAGLILQGGQGHFLILLASAMAAVPLCVVMAAWLLTGLKRDTEVPARLETLFRGCLLAVGCLLLSIISASVMRWIKVREAQAYVADMIPLLEDYRATHRHYPLTLTEIQKSGTPSLLAYSAEGGSYCFEYREPFFLSSGRLFDGNSRQWVQIGS